jgi:outer membrane protein
MRFMMIGLLLTSLLVSFAFADAPPAPEIVPGSAEADSILAAEPTWAVGVAMRSSIIPFATDERKVSTFIPFVYYDDPGGIFYFRGLEGGATFLRPGDWQFSAMGRLRFMDIPAEYQNQVQGDTFMGGLQARYAPFGPWHLDLEVLSDMKGHELANARLGGIWADPRLTLRAYFQAQYKTSKFNSYYFGLQQEDVSSGVELGVGASAMYSIASNFFVFGRAETSLLDKPARNVSFVNHDMTVQVFLGAGFKNDRTRSTPSVQKTKRYVRLAHGWVTPSSLSDIMNFKAESDPDNHQMTSIFYGHPLSDTLVGIPINVYFHSGFGWHWKNKKESIQEFILAVKFYYTIPLPIRLKLGVAEGWSWVTDIPYVEDQELREKGYEPSQLLNYLNFSVDLNLGDIFGGKTLDRTWLGYDIHHRSAIFESASQFGRIKGGSNVQMVYLQYDF